MPIKFYTREAKGNDVVPSTAGYEDLKKLEWLEKSREYQRGEEEKEESEDRFRELICPSPIVTIPGVIKRPALCTQENKHRTEGQDVVNSVFINIILLYGVLV